MNALQTEAVTVKNREERKKKKKNENKNARPMDIFIINSSNL